MRGSDATEAISKAASNDRGDVCARVGFGSEIVALRPVVPYILVRIIPV